MEDKRKANHQDETGLVSFKPIGTVQNQSGDASWGESLQSLPWEERAARMKAQTQGISRIIIDPELEPGLDRLEDYSHIQVIYYPHLVPVARKETPNLKVHPLGSQDFPEVGVFATRSPIRPNCILVTQVRLLKREGNILEVSGLDALDGSPVLDIKPGMPDTTSDDIVTVPAWMQKLNRNFVNEMDQGKDQ